MNTSEHQQAPVAVDSDWGSSSHTQTLMLMLATALSAYLCYLMVLPFFAPLAWALAFSVLFAPMQAWLERKLKRPSLAAWTTVCLIALIAVVPTAFIGQQLVQQASEGASVIEAKVSSGEWRKVVAAQPQLAQFADRIEQQLDLPGTAKEFAAWISSYASSFVKGSLYQLIGLGLTFYLLFFFLRDRDIALRSLCGLSPLSEGEMRRLFTRVADTIHATVYGTLTVAAVQGLLGGLMFWWLGLSAPLLWGVVMAALAVIPVLGAFVVWVPACLWLLLEGSWGKALILALWGMLVVGTVDNLLRPILVGSRLQLHTLLAFLSVVGGIMVFGTAGLILGPVTLTLATVLLEIWVARARAETRRALPPAS